MTEQVVIQALGIRIGPDTRNEQIVLKKPKDENNSDQVRHATALGRPHSCLPPHTLTRTTRRQNWLEAAKN